MSYNGSGVFNINTAGQPVVTGTVISSTAFNALTADLATGLSTAITKDGQTTTTARILFAQGVSSTLVTDATSSTTGSIITAGGISCQKALVVGTTAASGAHTITDTSANTLAVGRQGATNPVLNVDASTASVVTGLNVKGAAAAAGLALSVTSSGTNENLTIDAKGSGTITVAGTSTGNIVLGTGGGNFGLGTTNPAGGAGAHDRIINLAGTTPSLTFGGSNAVGTIESINGASGYLIFNGSASLRFQVNSTEVARFNTSGELLVGCTAAPSGSVKGALLGSNANKGYLQLATNTTASDTLEYFYNPNGLVGSITTSASATAYNTSSDARLKDNIADAGDAGAIIDALKVRQWDWKVDGLHQDFGFIAQEEAQVYAPAVTVGDDGEEIERQWQRDDSKLVPVLVKEIQSLRRRLAALEAK